MAEFPRVTVPREMIEEPPPPAHEQIRDHIRERQRALKRRYQFQWREGRNDDQTAR